MAAAVRCWPPMSPGTSPPTRCQPCWPLAHEEQVAPRLDNAEDAGARRQQLGDPRLRLGVRDVGGHGGAINARVAAAILNASEVRQSLLKHGRVIPDDTIFVPAVHDTSTDIVSILDHDRIPASHHVDIAQWAIGMEWSGPTSVDPVSVTHPVPFRNGHPTQDDRYNTATEFVVRALFPVDRR